MSAHAPSLPPKESASSRNSATREYGHIHVESVNLLALADSTVRANVQYQNDGAEGTEFKSRSEILLSPVPDDPIEQKKIEDDHFNALIKEIRSTRPPLSSLPVHRPQVDPITYKFPLNATEEYKAGKRGIFFMGRFLYFGGGRWNHSDYCVIFKVNEPLAITCFGHNEEPKLH